jgi:antitoxin component of MazEF toxin-antitoxin module
MEKYYHRPMTIHRYGQSLAVTIPGVYAHELELAPGDRVLFKREPDGLKLRIIRHPTMGELANETQEVAAQADADQESTETQNDAQEAMVTSS